MSFWKSLCRRFHAILHSDSDSGELPATGGDVPMGAIWLGIGAVGLGGIAVTAAAARRRASQNS